MTDHVIWGKVAVLAVCLVLVAVVWLILRGGNAAGAPAKGSPPVGNNTPSRPPTASGVANGRQPANANDFGLREGVARGRHGPSANAPAPTPTLKPSRSYAGLPSPVIPEADAAMRFRIWLLEYGLEQIRRGHGELIAGIDLWWLAQRFARGSGFRISSHDRFFEELRKLPGVHKENDRRVMRLRGARQKRVAYSFRPAAVADRRAAS